jgi:hypothetical protein
VTFFYWASDPIKDILANLRNTGSPVWEFPQDAPPEYVRHLNSDRGDWGTRGGEDPDARWEGVDVEPDYDGVDEAP